MMISMNTGKVTSSMMAAAFLASIIGQGESANIVSNNLYNKNMKVFGVGLSKTGTTSMAEAIQSLGYHTIHNDRSLAPFMHHSTTPANLTGYYDDVDSVWDIPTAAYYRQLLKAYPDAKFILTTRESGDWYKSFRSFLDEYMRYIWGCKVPERVQRLHEYVYGSRLPYEKTWIDSYERHNNDVRSFFAMEAPDQLLEIDVAETNKWNKLCVFLNADHGPCSANQEAPFPHTNVAAYHNIKKECPKDDIFELDMEDREIENFAYVTLLCDAAQEEQKDYVQMLLVLAESIRRFDQQSDIVTMVHGEIDEEQWQILEREGFKLWRVEAVGNEVTKPEPFRVPSSVSACYRSKLRALQLTQYNKVIFLDNDLLVKQDLRHMFQGDGFFAFEGYESPLNAGFFAVSPSHQALTDIEDILLSDSFNPKQGWLDVGTFPHWRLEGETSDWSFWCAHTDQGILYYYYDKLMMQATILSRNDAADLFTHFTGLSKPSAQDAGRLGSPSYSEWSMLWDRVKARLESTGADSRTVTNSAHVSSERIRRTLRTSRGLDDPYGPYGPPTPPPVACDPEEEAKLVLWNADTDTPIGEMGSVIDICAYGGAGLSIEAKPVCKEKVRFKLFDSEGNKIMRKDEAVAPFMVGGHNRKGNIKPLADLRIPGTYTLMVNPRPGDKQFFDFDVVGC